MAKRDGNCYCRSKHSIIEPALLLASTQNTDSVRVHKWSEDRKWSRTANDPQIGPQMIPDRKWSPFWTANDPDQQMGNGMDGGMVWIENWRTWIPMFLFKPSYNYNGLQLDFFFSYFRLNFVANYDVMNITTQSSKHDLAYISLQFSIKLWSVHHTLHILLCYTLIFRCYN